MKDQCKQAVAQALGKSTLTQQEAKKIEQRINEAMKNRARQDVQRWRNLSDAEKLKEAADQVAIDIKADLIRKREIVASDIVTTHKRLSELTDNRNKLPAMERVDRMIDFYGDLSGVQSVNRHSISIATDYKGRLYEFYKKINGITRLIQDDVLANNIIRERFGENTGDALAKKISDEIGSVADDMRDRFNRNGGDIGKLDGWGLWTAWDSVKTFSKGVDRFIQLGLKNIKRDEYVHEDGTYFNEQELTDLLRESWVTIKSEGANKNEVGKANFSGNSKITNRHSESRVLHWKDADAWIEMQKEFGNKSLFEIIDSNVSRMSKDIALVEYFGSNPTATFKMLLDSAAKIDSGDGIIQNFRTKMRRSRAEDMFNEFTGQIGIGHEVVANLWRGYRSANVGGMLGGTTLTATTDHATMVKMANAHGLSIQKLYGNELSLLNPANTADREFALYMGFGINELTSTISRFADEGLTEAYGRAATFAKVMDAAASSVLRVSGLTAITQIRKQAFDITMGAKYADMTRTKAWKDLDATDKEWFVKTGLNERAWEVMRLAEPKQMPGSKTNVLSIRSIYEIPDNKLTAFGNPQKVREEVATQFQTHLLDEQGMAIIESGLREKTKFTGGTKAGTFSGEALRLATQFKSFPLAMLMRHSARAFAQEGFKGKAAYAIPLITGLTILGGVSLLLKDIAKGENPSEVWDGENPYLLGFDADFLKRSVVAGGGLPIIGDIIATGNDPLGRNTEGLMTGPIGGDFRTLLGLTVGNAAQWYEGKDTNAANEAYRFGKGKIPGQNVWFAGTALNRLIFDDFQKTLAPDYQRRQQQKMRKLKRSQWWKQNGDIEAPDFSGVVK